MEPPDPTNNDEAGGFSKRRISSILKAPRKSIRFTESEQQENTVECVKPVEKRISRRVSFAPANDVLLFSKDVKNSSPVRGPLQELTTPAAATTQNRIQMMVTEDGIQQIAGMETLLNAPLHALQQKDKANVNTGNDFGDKTLMFHTDDAFMDMTNCHTINIANDSVFLEDTLHQSNDVLPTYGEKTLMFSAGDGSMDMTLNHTLNMTCSRDSLTTARNIDLSVEKKNRSSAVLDVDLGFKNFLANLAKQSASSVNPMISKISPISASSSEKIGATNASLAHPKTQSAVLDKENQAPPSVSTVRDKSLNTTKKFGESFNRSAVGPDNNMSMDITEAQTGCIMGVTDEDNPFQCLFPTQEMYAETENRSQTAHNLKTSQQESSKTLGSSTVRAPAITETRVQKVIADDRSRRIADEKSLIHPSLHTSHQRLEINSNAEDGGPEKTIVFTTDDAFMDMTQSQTVNIASVPLAPSSQHVDLLLACGKKDNASLEQRKSVAGATSANRLDPGFKNLFTDLSTTPGGPIGNPVITTEFPTAGSSSKTSGKTDVSLSQLKPSNVTMCFEDDASMDMTEAQTGHILGFTDTDDPFQSLFPTQDMYGTRQKNSDTVGSSNRKGLETSFKASLKTNAQNHQVKFDSEEDCRDRTVRFTAEDACMDVTQSCTVNIAPDFEPQTQENFNLLPTFGEKTVRFNANDASMDVTRSHTVNIATDFEPQTQEKLNLLPAYGEKTVRFNANDASMDVTRSHTVNIATDFEPQAQEKLNLLPAYGEKTVRFNTNDASMDVTRSHTVNIDTDLPLHSHQDLDFLLACGDKTVRFNANDAAMDMTQCLAVNIASNLGMSSSSSSTAVNTSSSLIQNQAPSGMSINGRKTAETSNGVVIGPGDDDDVSMEITEAQTGRIIGITGSDDPLQWKGEIVSHQQRPELGSSNSKGMDSTLRAPLQTKMQRHQVKYDAEEDLRERTVRFSVEEACMDVTRSHTVNIATECVLQSKQNMEFLPSFGEKTLKFDADDACMDVTRCHTVNISPSFGPQAEKTLRFTAEDACMDVTKSHTVNIVTDFEPQSQEHLNPLNRFCEKTGKCHTNDESVDLKHSPTVTIATDIKPKSLRKSDLLPRSEEKTMRFSTEDAAMNMTQCLTVNIGVGSDIPQADSDVTMGIMDSVVENRQHVTSAVQRSRSSLAHSLDPAFKTSLSRTSGPWANPVVKAADTPSSEGDTEGSLGHFQTQKARVDPEKKLSGLVSDVMEKPVNESMKNDKTLNKSEHCQEDDVNMDMTEAQTGHILGHTFTEDPSQCPPVKDLHPDADKATSQDSSEASSLNNVEINNPPNSLDLEETRKDHEERHEAGALPKKSNSPVDEDVKVPSRKSRRMSLADIQSKVRRLSQMINSAPDDIAVEGSTPHLSQLEENLCKNSDKTKSLSEVEPDPKVEERNSENTLQVPAVIQEEPLSTSATPFNLKTKQLMSLLSVSGFKPKLPRKSKPDPKKADSSLCKGEHTKAITINVPNHLSSFDHDVSDIYDEELESYEDMSETLDMRSPQKDAEKPQEFNTDVKFGDDICEEDILSAGFGQKRPLLEDENCMEGEKRMKQSKDVADTEIQSDAVECDSNITAAPSIHTNDSSTSGHTASMRCEATFESTWKQSLFESQIEDYASDIQMKFDNGTLTVLEFFKLFNIDFVIHNPRQSILPGRLLSDTDRTPMDLLKDRHISHPKQLVYEANVQSLTEQVEGLKVRMRDLDKPLKIVNRPLWEEMGNFSETELKAFGAKLKERNNLFRKMSKVQSHEMKEVLYSDLVRVNLEEQIKLRAKIDEADKMIKSLDDCIQQIETDLAGVEEDVKSHQEGLKKVNETLVDNDREMSELEMQKKQNLNKVNRLKNEAKKFESHITMLNTINEWRLGEKKDNCTVYTFLHETLLLELVYEKSNGNDAGNESELKMANISFKHQFDEEKSQFHARLVHRLVSQYTTGETDWVKKYPTSKHVPQLLHDVSVVVSRCRLLGEELRRLKLWGSLRFDILDISCTGTEIHIIFSTLKTFSKFEVVFSVSLINHVCVLQVQSFRNIIGCTTIQQIEEIVASFTPANNVLTKIVKNIHSSLLC